MVDLAFLLSQTGHALTTELTAKLASAGITPRGLCVLKHAREEELTQIRLAERCRPDKTTMVVTLDELERRGLAERRLSATARRPPRASGTPPGGARPARGAGGVAGSLTRAVPPAPDDGGAWAGRSAPQPR